MGVQKMSKLGSDNNWTLVNVIWKRTTVNIANNYFATQKRPHSMHHFMVSSSVMLNNASLL